MVPETQTIIPPYDRCAPGGAASGDTAAAFAVFLGVPALGDQPVEGMGGGGEGPTAACRKSDGDGVAIGNSKGCRSGS